MAAVHIGVSEAVREHGKVVEKRLGVVEKDLKKVSADVAAMKSMMQQLIDRGA